MKNIDDGVIKYDHSDFTLTNPLELSEYKEIEKLRSVLFQIKLIGCYEQNSVGYGNISCKKNYLHLFRYQINHSSYNVRLYFLIYFLFQKTFD